ncbi:tRNA uridine-5-carboxymethylaminomethyl(34) synthesis GTPase MnmE [Pikeienuella piscinae]|uniref:tRNA modification GTPase MnmE n=1 Tax=Pikeienuella piscinae TaxID=2748098 RepID=A0A7L5BVB4_9RHOB|nr:tRNA uridine-5-carboxymethylaminomethyl(34) synthesis GTPase MnmE [Pikeienuella piscinae]QIE56290.1 tRNA uridine-5-carboxymethylaminomethyl(34) synthesis GTPase MnmE [Pikeienuella piscinae]
MPVSDNHDTIFAPATAAGRAGVAVIRVSGPDARHCIECLAGSCPAPRYMSLRRLKFASDSDETIDQALVVFFEARSSYTGESMAEFHVHGGRATLARVLEALSGIPGLRMAAPGEFTRRALINGKLDLTQAEGLADLIDAETESQRRQALALTEGRFSSQIASWRGRLIDGLALIEAAIEFGDEVDISDEDLAAVRSNISEIGRELKLILEASAFSKKVREGFEVALVGPPNVGKSSLINMLAEKESAIVSPIAGTTRDVLRIPVDINGLYVTFLDMAGLRDTSDEIEKIGVERALLSAEAADIRILMSSADTRAEADLVKCRDNDIRVWAKCDNGVGPGDINLSTVTGDGVAQLLDMIFTTLSRRAAGSGYAAHKRQLDGLRNAVDELEAALNTNDEEVCAAHAKYAIRALEGIVDPVGAEDVLDEVFARFCIGK